MNNSKEYEYKQVSEGLMNYYTNKNKLKKYRKAKEEFEEERKKLIRKGFKLWRNFRDDLQNRVYEFRKKINRIN